MDNDAKNNIQMYEVFWRIGIYNGDHVQLVVKESRPKDESDQTLMNAKKKLLSDWKNRE